MTWISKRHAQILRIGLLAGALTGCTRNVQIWPPPLAAGSAVTVRFSAPRVIALDDAGKPDSVQGVQELRGRLVRLDHDTLVVMVAKERNILTNESRLAGREIQVLLDQSTAVIGSEVDGWKFAYGILAGAVLIFVGIVLSGS
jgi:hypothetical protein